ncbi:hypothetical protein BO83DRAFT_438111 [Aspergillus eucalypticola CBS 122712]|uniref:Uncharacterized protein n=1 Tax=Aspergillus eucalypticola (strain CBS 122712 / IBT 29274) TaxID=1448314 RepID=A0A317VAA3_ASPEC|nr:uncharacterized protein BO83DRAFT_438111 [Aspergillus eucalypticola CBS 122712]PWY71273.1 hypothetical protein BO83DRAFT_438111 [Aspergillus eucalypticola CBS 122712]
MPEAPNSRPFPRASRGSSFAPSTTHPLRAPLLTDYADLNTGHQGHTPSYLTAPTIFGNTTTPNSNHGNAQVHADHRIFWPSDGPEMYLAPPMPATIPGSMQSNTHDHPNTDIYQSPTNLALEPHFGGIFLSQDKLVENVHGRVAHIPSLSDGQETWRDMCEPFMKTLKPTSVQSVGSGSTATITCFNIGGVLITVRIRQQGITKGSIFLAARGWPSMTFGGRTF